VGKFIEGFWDTALGVSVRKRFAGNSQSIRFAVGTVLAMASEYRIEYDRGIKDAVQQLAVLREKWPLAFPVNEQDARPLTNSVAREVAAAMGWSHVYTFGVLGRWKLTAVYCQAVLRDNQRIALDGSPAEPVEPEAKAMARKRPATLAARKASQAAKKAAKVGPAAAAVKEVPAPPLPTRRAPLTAEELRARVRASLLRA